MKHLQIMILSCLLFANTLYADEIKVEDHETSIISLVLEATRDEFQNAQWRDGYILVHPQTKKLLEKGEEEYAKNIKEIISKEMKIQNNEFKSIIDIFLSKNKSSIKISVKSDLSKGYEIDLDGKYQKHLKTIIEDDRYTFEEGRSQFFKDNPTCFDYITISRPAYDQKNGIILICRGQSHIGYYIAYKLKDQKLVEIARTRAWME